MLGKHINHCEDSLTASVFTHLLHLPIELFWRILRDACYTDRLPHHSGDIQDTVFWPSWDSTGTNNSNRVVPDLFLRFADFDLIIEAKRWDDGMQNAHQWRQELIAYANEYGDEARPVKMIALGGLLSTNDDKIVHSWSAPNSDSRDSASSIRSITCPVHMCRWRGLLDQCKKMQRDLDRLSFQSSQTAAHARILAHTIDLFGCHGFSTGQWFDDFELSSCRLSSSVIRHLDFFNRRSQDLQRA